MGNLWLEGPLSLSFILCVVNNSARAFCYAAVLSRNFCAYLFLPSFQVGFLYCNWNPASTHALILCIEMLTRHFLGWYKREGNIYTVLVEFG